MLCFFCFFLKRKKHLPAHDSNDRFSFAELTHKQKLNKSEDAYSVRVRETFLVYLPGMDAFENRKITLRVFEEKLLRKILRTIPARKAFLGDYRTNLLKRFVEVTKMHNTL